MANNKKFSGLGKGLGSLIPSGNSHIQSSPGQPRESVFYIETGKIKPNPDQPRRTFDQEGLQSLAASIKKYGVLQPLLVNKAEITSDHGLDVEYRIIAGERRWRAAQLASVPHVPVIVKDQFNEDPARLEIALIENVQREDLNPLEEGVAYKRLISEFNLTQKEVAEKVSKSREVIANALRLLDLPSDMQESLRVGKLSRTQARTLLSFKDHPDKQREVYAQILEGKMSVRDIEKEAKSVKSDGGANKNKERENRFKELENNLTNAVKAPVRIVSGASGGSVVMRFKDLEGLNKIVEAILD